MITSSGTGATDIGLEREQNEDRFYVNDEIGLYVVVDGMGGHRAGEVAAALAIRTISRFISQRRPALDRIRRGRELKGELTTIARAAVISANQVILRHAERDRRRKGMGCTVTLLLIAGRRAVMAHVGDSRLYLLRDRRFRQLSTDHTLANELVRQGVMSEVRAWAHPQGDALVRAVGPQRRVQVDTIDLDPEPGDRFLLASDGLTQYVFDDVWLGGRLAEADLCAVPSRLIDLANRSGGSDNVTVVAVEVIAVEANNSEDSAQAA